METLKPIMKTVKKEEKKSCDVVTILYIMYLLFEANMLTRRHLQDLMKLMKEPLSPEEVAKRIGEEIKKVS